jgi:hypothetical protein
MRSTFLRLIVLFTPKAFIDALWEIAQMNDEAPILLRPNMPCNNLLSRRSGRTLLGRFTLFLERLTDDTTCPEIACPATR